MRSGDITEFCYEKAILKGEGDKGGEDDNNSLYVAFSHLCG